MAYMGDIQIRRGEGDSRQIMNYLTQLEEQVRYALQNIDGENIQAGAISEKQLGADVQGRLDGSEKTVKEIREAQARQGALIQRALQQAAQAAKVMDGSLPFQIYVGAQQPEGQNILWIVPGTPVDGVAACSVKYIGEEEEA